MTPAHNPDFKGEKMKKKVPAPKGRRSAAPTKEKTQSIETRAQLMRILSSMGKMDKARRNAVTCALIGHSKIQTHCFGYYNCARCGEQVGDALGSTYSGAKTAVVVGHECDLCKTNFKACTWKDKVFCPPPFKAEVPPPKSPKGRGK